jgi:hypothetical protein
MLVCHFVSANYGLEDLRLRRLKIATIDDLNDPFELLCVDLSNPELRTKMKSWKAAVAMRFGMVCFSRTWRNPVQWSHYADKHRGLRLVFNVPDESVQLVTYSGRRSGVEAIEQLERGIDGVDTVLKFLSTKYAHWRYEQEVRSFIRLDERDSENAPFFTDFSDKLKLQEVIVGAESKVSRAEVTEALGDLSATVSIRNALLASKSFRVTNQRDPRLWG